MKRTIILTFIIIFVTCSFAQEKAVTQAEYVKMLYALQKNPSGKADIIAALRKRGIDFVLNDGLRGLTRSKGGNDEELKRALEEADRRRQNPAGAALPSKTALAAIIEKTRKNTLEAVDEMPDFVVKQQIQRSAAYAGTGNFRNLDNLVVAVSYRSSGQEEYKLLTLNGAVQNNPQTKESYEEAGGTSSTGEFVTMLATIFKPESLTEFEGVDTDLIRGRKAVVYDFSVTRDKAHQIVSAAGYVSATTVTGMKGRIWIDRDDFRVLRIDSEATEIPESFPIRTAKRTIDYDWTTISDEKYLLPSLSDVRLTFRDNSKVFESRNLIRFKNYQKYGTEVKILDDDVTPEPETKKPNR